MQFKHWKQGGLIYVQSYNIFIKGETERKGWDKGELTSLKMNTQTVIFHVVLH